VPYVDNIHYTTHVLERINQRDGIDIPMIEATLEHGEVIEEYETEEESRYLMHYSRKLEAPLERERHYHVVAADQSTGRTVVITAYDPTEHPERWSEDYKRRVD
jgi:hypothetical protein